MQQISVYYNKCVFCDLLNSFISYNSCLVESLGFSIYSFMSSALWQFYFFFTNLNAFYLFFLSDFLSDRTSNTILNKSGKSMHPHLVLDLREKAFNFIPLSMLLAEDLTYLVSVMLRLYYVYFVSSVPSLLRVFIINGG